MKNVILLLFAFTFSLIYSVGVSAQSADAYSLEININDFKKTSSVAQLYKTFESELKVVSYTIDYNSNGLNSAHLENGRLSGALKKTILAEFPNQTKVSISKVKAKNADGKLIDVKPLTITLIQ